MIRMRYASHILLLSVLVFISGCVTNNPAMEKGLALKMDANPRSVFAGGTATITLDAENLDTKTLKDVSAEVFETGMFEYANRDCKKSFGDMEPQDFKTFACNLKAKEKSENTIWARAKFSSTLSAVQTVDILSQAEWETRQKTGAAADGQKSFSFGDNNLEIAMDFSDAPIIVSGKKNYVSFTVKNTGSGFIEKLAKDKINVGVKNANLNCQQQDIFIKGREFPRFICEIAPTGAIGSFITAEISISIGYDYEMRSSVSATIV